jgi:hypothetical protein
LGDAGQPAWGVWLSRLEQGAPPGEAIEDALRWLLEATAAQVAVLFLPDPSGEGVEFAYVAGERADELRGFRLRPTDALVAPALLNREVWRYSAETYQEPIGAIATGIAVPLPSLPKSALALLNRPAPFDDAHLDLLEQIARRPSSCCCACSTRRPNWSSASARWGGSAACRSDSART